MSRGARPTVTRPEQMEAIGSPVRNLVSLTLAMLRRASIAELAAHLGRSPESLYYHVRRLQAVGIVEPCARRLVNGRAEALYRLVGGRLRVDPRQATPRFERAYARGAATLLRHAQRAYTRAVGQPETQRAGRGRNLVIRQLQVRMSRATLREFNRRFDQLVAFVRQADDRDATDFYLFTAALCPAGRVAPGRTSRASRGAGSRLSPGRAE